MLHRQAALPQACACKFVVRQTATLWSRGWARTGQETTPATCQELSQVSAQVILLQKSQACANFSQRFSQRYSEALSCSAASGLRDRSQPDRLFLERRCFFPRLLLDVFFPRLLPKPPLGRPQAPLYALVQLLQPPPSLSIRAATTPVLVAKRVVRHAHPAARTRPARSQDVAGRVALRCRHGCAHGGLHAELFVCPFPHGGGFVECGRTRLVHRGAAPGD